MADEQNTLDQFHILNKKGEAYRVNQEKLIEYVLEEYPMMAIGRKVWLYGYGVFKLDEYGDRLKRIYRHYIYAHLINDGILKSLYNLTFSYITHKEYKDVPVDSKYIINFKNVMYNFEPSECEDVIKKEEWEEFPAHDPNFYSINQIPHDLVYYPNPKRHEMSVFFRFIETTIPNDDDRQMLYDFMALCLTTITEAQQFLIIFGEGGTGKSTIIDLITKIVGFENTSSLSLQDLEKRFQSVALLGKLVNVCADIPSTALKETATLKKITGEDTVSMEYKGGKTFEAKPHVKIIMSANKVPANLDDTSNAYYRRLLALEIPKKGEHIENLRERLEDEIPLIISFLINRLKAMAINGFTVKNSANSERIKRRMRRDVDNVLAFVEDVIIEDENSRVKKDDVFERYQEYCRVWGRKELGRNTFYARLGEMGIKKRKIGGERCFVGIKMIKAKITEVGQ